MLIGDWLAHRALLTPHRPALIDAERGMRPMTYREWSANADRTALLLRERLDVRRGDRVAILAYNSVAYLEVWFACARAGALLQNLNWRLATPELLALVADAQPAALLYGPEFTEQANAIRAANPALRLVALDAGARADESDTPLDARDTLPPGSLAPVEMCADDPWVICYTGGTTGLPKGAVLTHGNIFWNIANTVSGWGLRPDDVAILNAPLFHTGGLNVLTAPLAYLGGTSIVCRGFDAGQVFDLIRDHGVTLLFGVPTMFIALQQHPRWPAADLSGLRWAISGGAPCPPPVFRAFRERGVVFRTGYGLTEAGPNTFWLPDEDVDDRQGAVGHPLPHLETQVINASGRPCGPGEVGELCIRGPHVFAGYWRRPEETARALDDGWLHTGDLARRDADGCHWIVGRSKDVIISGGENIYPAEVEGVLAAHPSVAEAALIAVADAKWGEVGRAVVVLRAGCSVQPADPADEAQESDSSTLQAAIIEFCRERLARYKIPKSVVFVEALPKTGAAKVDKQRLREMYGH